MDLPNAGNHQIRFFSNLAFCAKIHDGSKRDRLQKNDVLLAQLAQCAAAEKPAASDHTSVHRLETAQISRIRRV